MLVCNVSAGPRRAPFVIGLVEASSAVDDSATGLAVLATLIDDPASVDDDVDAYLGDIMVEAASATEVADTALAYSVLVDEVANAVEIVGEGAAFSTVTLNEAATAADSYAVIAGTTIFDSATASAGVTISNGGLTATHTNNTGNVGCRSVSLQSTGKYYFEVTATVTSGYGNMIGLINSSANYLAMVNNGTGCCTIGCGSGNFFTPGSGSGTGIGAVVSGDVIGVAVDFTAGKIWFRKNSNGFLAAAGGTQNPVTGQGGALMGAGSFSPTVGFDSFTSGDNMTANFGTSAFLNAAPSGFGNWPA
jgi:SPRY domain